MDYITEFCWDIIHGTGGLIAYEQREMGYFGYDNRVNSVIWAIRCLANPENPVTEKILEAIMERREKVKRKLKREEKKYDVQKSAQKA